jgi:hypothetical protein
MKLYTKSELDKMKKNWEDSQKTGNDDHKPVVKWFNPVGAATWLISAIDESEEIAFGLCDLGMGEPELGYVSVPELKSIRLRFGLGIEKDRHITFDKPLLEYARVANIKGSIVC